MAEEYFEVRDRRNGNWFWCQNLMLKAKIPHTIKLTYFAFCSYANKNTETCYPSISRVSKITSISRSSIIRAIEALEKGKVIRIKKEKGKVNQYILLKLTSATMTLVSKEALNQSHLRHKTSSPREPKQMKRTNEKNKRVNKKGMQSLKETMQDLNLKNKFI